MSETASWFSFQCRISWASVTSCTPRNLLTIDLWISQANRIEQARNKEYKIAAIDEVNPILFYDDWTTEGLDCKCFRTTRSVQSEKPAMRNREKSAARICKVLKIPEVNGFLRYFGIVRERLSPVLWQHCREVTPKAILGRAHGSENWWFPTEAETIFLQRKSFLKMNSTVDRQMP